MTYRVLVESFAATEFRAVFVPLSGGRRRPEVVSSDESHESHDETGVNPGVEVLSLSPLGGGGGSGSDSGAPLVDALKSVKRSHSDLAKFSSWNRKGRESLRRAGIAAEEIDPDPQHWGFLTVTFPACVEGSNAAIAANSGWIVKYWRNSLREYEHKEPAYFYVWERQRRGTLHLHLATRLSPDCSVREAEPDLHRKHARLCKQILFRTGVNVGIGRSGIDWSDYPDKLRIDFQRVRKGVGRYLAKYCSKNSQAESEKWAALDSPSPQRWWGCSQSIKEKCKELLVTRRVDVANYMAASNKFTEVVEILELYKGSGVSYSGDINGVSGRYYSMFKPRSKVCPMIIEKGLQANGKRFVRQAALPDDGPSCSIRALLPPDQWQALKVLASATYDVKCWTGFQDDIALASSTMFTASEWGLQQRAIRRLLTSGNISLLRSGWRLTTPSQRPKRMGASTALQSLQELLLMPERPSCSSWAKEVEEKAKENEPNQLSLFGDIKI